MLKAYGMVFVMAAAFSVGGCQPSEAPPEARTGEVQANDADRAFIDGLVPHHEMAIAMADEALAKATHAELKTFAQKVKDDQTREINQMKQYRQEWFASNATPSMDHSQMTSMAAGPDFDRMWSEAMIKHHQGATDMANRALTAAARPETKTLAQQVIDAQKKEQDQLRAWINAW
jgi:uncharacterized protein (DUF305 family)